MVIAPNNEEPVEDFAIQYPSASAGIVLGVQSKG